MVESVDEIRIGIVGAENTHAVAFARAFNVARDPVGFRVTHIWGETVADAERAASEGGIARIVGTPEEMLGQVDAVIVAHRDGGRHAAVAQLFLEAGLPVFVDKPICNTLAEASRLLACRRRCGVALTSLSLVPYQGGVAGVRQQLAEVGAVRAVHVNGPGDPASPHGGLFFYGIHQAELLVALFGVGAERAVALGQGSEWMGALRYPDGMIATLGMTGAKGFSITVVGTDGAFHAPLPMDADPYQAVNRMVAELFRDGTEPCTDERLLAPIAMLEALETAGRTRMPVLVSAVRD